MVLSAEKECMRPQDSNERRRACENRGMRTGGCETKLLGAVGSDIATCHSYSRYIHACSKNSERNALIAFRWYFRTSMPVAQRAVSQAPLECVEMA